MNASRVIKFVSVGLLAVGLIVTFFAANFYYIYCYTISPGFPGYDCRNILTFPQLIAGVGVTLSSSATLLVTTVKLRKKNTVNISA